MKHAVFGRGRTGRLLFDVTREGGCEVCLNCGGVQ